MFVQRDNAAKAQQQQNADGDVARIEREVGLKLQGAVIAAVTAADCVPVNVSVAQARAHP